MQDIAWYLDETISLYSNEDITFSKYQETMCQRIDDSMAMIGYNCVYIDTPCVTIMLR